MTIIQLALISIMAFYPMEWATVILSVLTVIFSSLFYWVCAKIVLGATTSTVNPQMDLVLVWTKHIVNMGTVAALLLSGGWYVYAGLFALSWVLITTMVNVVATLMRWGWVELLDDDEE
jgi:hypothetical protein